MQMTYTCTYSMKLITVHILMTSTEFYEEQGTIFRSKTVSLLDYVCHIIALNN